MRISWVWVVFSLVWLASDLIATRELLAQSLPTLSTDFVEDVINNSAQSISSSEFSSNIANAARVAAATNRACTNEEAHASGYPAGTNSSLYVCNNGVVSCCQVGTFPTCNSKPGSQRCLPTQNPTFDATCAMGENRFVCPGYLGGLQSVCCAAGKKPSCPERVGAPACVPLTNREAEIATGDTSGPGTMMISILGTSGSTETEAEMLSRSACIVCKTSTTDCAAKLVPVCARSWGSSEDPGFVLCERTAQAACGTCDWYRSRPTC